LKEKLQIIKKIYISGSGNIFTVFDNRIINETKEFFSENAEILTTVNPTVNNTVNNSVNNISNKIIQTEGIVVLNNSNNFDFEVWFFNPDGSSGMMCGNGGRVAIYFAIKNGFIENYKDDETVSFEMNNTVYLGKKNADLYSIFFPPAVIFPKEIEIIIENNFGKNENVKGYFANVGTEHFAIEKENINEIDVDEMGKKIRNNSCFLPQGTNVNFFEKSKEMNTIFLRTYEKGVENETGACGTGSISTALVYFKKYGYSGKLKIIPTSKSLLFVDLIFKNNFNSNENGQNDLYSRIDKIILSGSVEEF